MNLFVLATWAVTGLATVAAAISVGRLLRMSRIMLAVFAMLCVLAVVAVARLARTVVPAGPVQVEITAPRNGLWVEGTSLSVEGIVRPAGARVTLVIRSERDPRWWVQPVVRPSRIADGVGYWTVKGSLGTKTEGIGQTFEVVALASLNNIIFDLLTGRYVTEGDFYHNVPLWSQTPPLVVWRRQ